MSASWVPLTSAEESCPNCSFWPGDAPCRHYHRSAGLWEPSDLPTALAAPDILPRRTPVSETSTGSKTAPALRGEHPMSRSRGLARVRHRGLHRLPPVPLPRGVLTSTKAERLPEESPKTVLCPRGESPGPGTRSSVSGADHGAGVSSGPGSGRPWGCGSYRAPSPAPFAALAVRLEAALRGRKHCLGIPSELAWAQRRPPPPPRPLDRH